MNLGDFLKKMQVPVVGRTQQASSMGKLTLESLEEQLTSAKQLMQEQAMEISRLRGEMASQHADQIAQALQAKEISQEMAREIGQLRAEIGQARLPEPEVEIELQPTPEEGTAVFWIDPEAGHNLYAYCVWEILHQGASWKRLFQAWFWLTTLLGVQILFTFGFFDGGVLELVLSQFSSFKSGISSTLFYVGNRSEAVGTVPYVNSLVAIVSTLLLASYMRDDNLGSLQCFVKTVQRTTGQTPRDEIRKFTKRLPRRVGLIAGWSMRMILLPAYAAIGSAVIFAQDSVNCTEIVLNSVAMAFVFELDETFYKWCVPRSYKLKYEHAYGNA